MFVKLARCCIVEAPVPPQDWRCTRVVDGGPTSFYRYRTEGENLNHTPECRGRRFSWRVPALDPRYDVTGVTIETTNALDF